MTSASSSKALWWKEWRQNRWSWMILFVIVTWLPVGKTVLKAVLNEPFVAEIYGGLPREVAWSYEVGAVLSREPVMLDNGFTFQDPPLIELAPFAVLVFGAWIVSRERMPDTTSVLASMPYTRGQILMAKVSFGSLSILAMTSFSLLFTWIIPFFFPAVYHPLTAVEWFLYVTPILLAAFALGVFAASWTANPVVAIGVSIGLMLFPVIIRRFVLEWLHIPSLHEEMAALQYHLLLPDLLNRYQWNEITWIIPPTLLFIGGILILSARALFQRNDLENNGGVVAIGHVRQWLSALVPILAGLCVLSLYIGPFDGRSPWWALGLMSTGTAITWYVIKAAVLRLKAPSSDKGGIR
ncbi:ABC transporter permease subunit [Desmospora profundinema]|uniref:ABC-type transport system involved in multi-copper enzyme maturation permease subunit n=1 Tax=Desmospora profundinema TaxID=1571184 RepID=A0ABU1IPG7_9BACL|nr:ABC transporter permease subunit [Desmospora profundinema]MDR6226684.1 ABC-type transport system involved in multi-copper enzyme maturation permease subunit [Desmospora profundinema]